MMPRRTLVLVIGCLGVLAIVAVALTIAVPRWIRGSKTTAAAAPSAPASPGRRIKARLFYVADDGARLTNVERDVAFGEGTVEQARKSSKRRLRRSPSRSSPRCRPATKLRAIFITDRGEAFVDFSRELATGHSGGSTNELLTVYTIVNALTANLPAVNSVQLLVDGKQVETLAGHVDLRRPLEKNLAWIQ